MYLRDQQTSSAFRVSTGTSTLVNIPQGQVYTILDYNLNLGADVSGAVASNQRTYSRITCGNGSGGTTTINFLNNTYVSGGSSFPSLASVGSSPFKCYNLVDLLLYNSGANNSLTFGSISYVPYDINLSSMATSTPYTSYSTYENGVYYSYNPLLAQIGMWILIASFICVVYYLFKLIKSFKIW